MSSCSLSSFRSGVPQHCSTVPMLYELLRGEEELSRIWLRAEMNQIADPLIDSLFHGLIMSSSSSAVPQQRSTELCKQLEGEKVEVSRVLRGEMDRVVNTLFERLTNKLRTNTNLNRSDNGEDRAQAGNLFDQVESHNPQSHQPSSHIAQPSTSSLNPVAHEQHSNGDELELNTAKMIEIKEEVEDGEEIRVVDIETLTEYNQSGAGDDGETTQQMDCVKQEIKEEFEDFEIKQEEEDETMNNEVKLEIKEEEEEEDGETQINDIDDVAEDNQIGGDESRLVENAQMDTTPTRPIGQSQVNRQFGRVEKRKQTDEEPQVQNEVNNQEDVEEDEVDDGEEVTCRSVKRARPSTKPSTTLSSTEDKQIITVTLRCPQLGCGEISKDDFNVHMWNRHSIGLLLCAVKDCGQSFSHNRILGEHLAQSHPHTTQWQCNKCSSHFSTYHHLSNHNFDFHQLGHFQCSFPSCTFTGEYRRKVFNHYTRQHKDKPEFVCAQSGCNYRTNHSTRFKAHERSHLGTKPYHCKWPNCHYSSTSQDYTMTHIKRIHFKSRSSLSPDLSHLGKPKDYLEVER